VVASNENGWQVVRVRGALTSDVGGVVQGVGGEGRFIGVAEAVGVRLEAPEVLITLNLQVGCSAVKSCAYYIADCAM